MAQLRSRLSFCLAIIANTTLAFVVLPYAYAQSGGNGQFLSTYAGPQTATELLVHSVSFGYDGTNFILRAVLEAPIGSIQGTVPTGGDLYVFGINRGNGTAGFAGLGATIPENGVLFDTIVAARPLPDTISAVPTLTVNRLGGGGSTTLNPATNMIASGSNLTLIIPSSALPSNGFAPTAYTTNLWPRFEGTFNGNPITGNAQISQFAPNNANLLVVVSPEPASLSLLGGAAALIGLALRRRRTAR